MEGGRKEEIYILIHLPGWSYQMSPIFLPLSLSTTTSTTTFTATTLLLNTTSTPIYKKKPTGGGGIRAAECGYERFNSACLGDGSFVALIVGC